MSTTADIERILKANRVVEALPTPDQVPETRGLGVISVQASDRLPHVFATLIEHKVQSVPVIENEKPIGFLDMIDILCFVHDHKVQSVPVIENEKPIGFLDIIDILCFAHDSAKELHQVGTDSEFIRQEVFSMVSARDVMNFSNKDPFEIVTSESSLWTAVSIMLEKSARRLAVVNPSGRITSVLSQVDVLRFLTPHISKSPSGSKSVSDLKLGTQRVKTVSVDSIARDAFTLLRTSGLSALGIVDAHGKLVANLSATDLKIIGQDSGYFRLLNLPLKELKAYASLPSPISVHTTDSLSKVIGQFNQFPIIHRVYVVDSEGRPTAIVSPIDILAELVVQ